MKKFLLASVMTAAFAAPAFADDMSCADFMAMDADAQMKAVGMMAGDDMMAEDMAGDDMKSDDMAADDMKSDDMASDDMAADDMAGDDMMAEDVTVDAVVAACGDDGAMMVEDAVMKAKGGM